MVWNEIGQQIPVLRFRRPLVMQPSPLGDSHRFATERVFSHQARAFELSLDASELERGVVIATSLRELSRKRHYESQSVLNIFHFHAFKQPIPIQIRVAQNYPRECFSDPRLKI